MVRLKRQRRAVVHDAPAHPAGDHRRAEPLRERAHLGARALGAAADEDHRPRGAVQQRRGAHDRLGIGLGVGDLARRLGSSAASHASCARTSIGISSATGRGRPVRICANASAIRCGASCGASMRAAHLVRRRMIPSWSGSSWSRPKPRPIRRSGTWPAEAQHRRVAGIGGRERGGGVEEARAGHDAIGAGPARGRGVAVGHVARRLLVAHHDHAQVARHGRRAR